MYNNTNCASYIKDSMSRNRHIFTLPKAWMNGENPLKKSRDNSIHIEFELIILGKCREDLNSYAIS